jgi:hypothetical protein
MANSPFQMTNSPFPETTRPARINPRQQRILSEVIEAARASPGSLRILNRDNWIYTAQHRKGRTRWIIQDCYRNPIADGVSS